MVVNSCEKLSLYNFMLVQGKSYLSVESSFQDLHVWLTRKLPSRWCFLSFLQVYSQPGLSSIFITCSCNVLKGLEVTTAELSCRTFT